MLEPLSDPASPDAGSQQPAGAAPSAPEAAGSASAAGATLTAAPAEPAALPAGRSAGRPMLPAGRSKSTADSPADAPAEPATAGRVPHGVLPGGLSVALLLRARPAALLLRVLLAAAAAATGYLLLAVLGHAAGHPGRSATSAPALLAWCVVPLAAVALLAVTAWRGESESRAATAWAEAGFGPVRLSRLAAAEAALACVIGSVAALVAFVYERERATVPAPLPHAGLVTLLAVVPLVVAVACLFGARTPAGWPYPVVRSLAALAAAAGGLALAAVAQHPRYGAESAFTLPGGLGRTTAEGLVGWGLVVAAPLIAGPGLVHLTGRIMSFGRPSAIRLLAGRVMQADARRIGLPLGALSCALCAALSAYGARGAGARPLGPWTLTAAAVVLACPAIALVCGAVYARRARSGTDDLLGALGAGHIMLRVAAVLRWITLAVLYTLLTCALGYAAIPHR